MLTITETQAAPVAPSVERQHVLGRRIRLIVAATIIYNLIEAVIAITAGTLASSGALIGFGLDSTIEVTSAVAVAWQFTRQSPEKWEKSTLRVIAMAFFALAAYVTFDSVLSLTQGEAADHSTVGIVLVAISAVVMPLVSFLERRAGMELGSASAVADSKQTLMCSYLSVAVLIGLVLNSWLGWWWADPAAALVIAALAVREGVEAWKGDGCALAAGRALDAQPGDGCCGTDGCTDGCCD
ncbi:cation transporter [Corynebacterium sp. TAE3-ERU12]|uniref:cation transporter n=1 Tax=Corynebacterium sp. TAE3-ERU12 TaxID=2849491 RepID=UPI001C460572|nr:cation transporter [Corynebacterium sp. TAE3-ERU12]MBV7295494.1 cation transporter [Corynebacterium sp. TAE3-ERU12]